MSSADRSSRASAVTEALRAACDSGAMLAGAVGLVVEGRVTRLTANGVLEPGGSPVDTKTLFGIGSITQLLLSLTVARVGGRSIPLDNPVSSLLPDLIFDDSDTFSRVTVRQLLSHTSGLPSAGRDWGPTDFDALSRFASEDLAHHVFQSAPGETATYSSTAISLVGLILERVMRRPFQDVLAQETLEHVGMGNSAFPAELSDGPVAWPHNRLHGEYERIDRLVDNHAGYPAGFLLASAEDLVSLAMTLFDGSMLGSKDLDHLATQQVSRHIDHVRYPLSLISSGYGLGCFTGTWNGQPVMRHGGMQQSYNCSFDVLPGTGSAIVLITNAADEPTFNEILALCYEAVAGPVRTSDEPNLTSVGSEEKSRMVGDFVDPDRGQLLNIADVDGDLVYQSEEVEAPVYHVGDGRAIVPVSYGSVPMWSPPGDGPVPYVTHWGVPFFRTRIDPWVAVDPSNFEGVFRDSFWPDPSTDLDIRLEDDVWMVGGAAGSSHSQVVGERLLVTDRGLVEFSEDGSALRLGNATIYERS